MVTEQEYFNQYTEESDVNAESIKFKIKSLLKYGVTDWRFYKQDISKIITTFQAMYYREKQVELSAEIVELEKYLNSVNKNLLEDLCKQSMIVLKDKLAKNMKVTAVEKFLAKMICGRSHMMFWLSIRLY